MNRWLVALLVLLAVVILVSPGIIGRLAEQNMEEGIEWAESESPGVAITTEAFDRGWFTSEGQHRVVLEGGQFQDATERYAAATGNPELPSLIIDTRIDHGLLPLSSLTRDSGSLVPGLASTISTFQLDPGNGVVVRCQRLPLHDGKRPLRIRGSAGQLAGRRPVDLFGPVFRRNGGTWIDRAFRPDR
jgi:uncharacterized protein YdgA (DUF945 family)